ncbi:MAG TPA: type II toxin-antitoxin system prevent-host-death family antitoxin [Thermoanaerobaculia bacterium]|nr:type II toxin-antitoxin system prevent-host-death family antitoxin [Thermoanaerobaculia bacterium]
MREVTLQYAQAHLPRLVNEARAGEEVVIVEEGTPLVRLTPVPAHRKRVFGLDQGKIVIREDFDEPMPEVEALFYGSPDDPA